MFKFLSAKYPAEPLFPGEAFSIFKLNLTDGWGLATINKAYDHYPNKSFFPWYAIINIQLQDQNENGHPTDREAEVLNMIEDSITRFLEERKTVHFIGRVIRKGERDVLYYLNNRKFNKKEIREFFDSLNVIRPIHFEVQKDPKWNLVNTFIK